MGVALDDAVHEREGVTERAGALGHCHHGPGGLRTLDDVHTNGHHGLLTGPEEGRDRLVRMERQIEKNKAAAQSSRR